MPRTTRSAAVPEKTAKKKAAAKPAGARSSSSSSSKATGGGTKAATPAKAAPAKKAAKAPAKATKPVKATKTTKATKAVKATKAKAPPDKFMVAQRELLLEERETYTRHATDLRAEAEQLAADREPGDVQFDEESGQGDTMNVERERDLALSAQAMAAVEDIDRALAKIDEGTYGICERCGKEIAEARLEAMPATPYCIDDAGR
jgi:RNA polymerase-binding transcription factor DksA